MSDQPDTMQSLRDAFHGIIGRQPTSEAELKNWLATDEGKLAIAFAPTDAFLWGEMHAGGVRDPAEEQGFRSDSLHE